MKLKYPKRISILNTTFKIIYSKEKRGGWFDFGDREIGIGTSYNNASEIFNIISHEILEICMVKLGVRYDDPSVFENYKFVLDHKEFETVNKLYSSIITKFIK